MAIILPCRNEASNIRECLASLLGQEPVDGGFALWVIDGMSDDGTREILAELARSDSRLHVIDNAEKIASAALNKGITSSSSEIVLRADAHASYASDYVRTCVEVLERTGASNVGGPARTRSRTPWQNAIAAAFHSPFSTGGAKFHRVAYEGPVDTVTYGCWPRNVFDQVGLFDVQLVRNQDDEHNLRIKRAGLLIWQSPSIRCWYEPRATLARLFTQYMQYGYWKIRVMQKHSLPLALRHWVPAVFVLGSGGALLAAPLMHSGKLVACGIWAAYGAAVALASVVTAWPRQWSLLARLPPVFMTYHIAYGLGFLRGVVDFLFLRRRHLGTMADLSR